MAYYFFFTYRSGRPQTGRCSGGSGKCSGGQSSEAQTLMMMSTYTHWVSNYNI